MQSFRVRSAAEQVALHLKDQINQGEIKDSIPGLGKLSKRLGVNAKTIDAAFTILEKEEVLINQGPRKKRLINLAATQTESNLGQIHLGILLYEPADRSLVLIVKLVHSLIEAGHDVRYAEKTLTELKMGVSSVKRVVEKKEVDAWIVVAGSREVLEWFSQQETPAFALFGRRNRVKLPSIGPETDRAFKEGVNYLIARGHQRIVKICRSERRKPSLGKTEREFLNTLRENRIPTGNYNLPDWEETPEGFQRLLESLFRVTPPTALIVDDVCFFLAALQFLVGKGLRVPEDVSIIAEKVDPSFDWCRPPLAHLQWDYSIALRRIVKWASKVSQGKSDFQRSLISAEFVAGGTIGPAPTKS